MYKASETVLPIYINGQCPIIKTCSDVTLNLSSKDSTCNVFLASDADLFQTNIQCYVLLSVTFIKQRTTHFK